MLAGKRRIRCEHTYELTSTSPNACVEPKVEQLLVSFVTAYNANEPQVAPRFFASVPTFKWFSDAPARIGNGKTVSRIYDPFDRSTLDAYLDERRAGGDRLRLVSFDFVGVSQGAASFAFVLERPDGIAQGKGAVDCRSGLMAVWSVGGASLAEGVGPTAGNEARD